MNSQRSSSLFLMVCSMASGLFFTAFAHGLTIIDTTKKNQKLEEILVTASPLSSSQQAESTTAVQNFSFEDIQQSTSSWFTDYLAKEAVGVSLSHAQNNPLQPDVLVRGFSASPLLGSSPGTVVTLNGVRVNEAFGDTINWDLLPSSIMDSATLLSGTNATFGLNALGGVLALDTVTGFNGNNKSINNVSLSSGSFGRNKASVLQAGNNERWGYAIALDGFQEDSWRDFSPSDTYNAYGSVSFRDARYTLDLTLLAGQSELHGNGTSPEQLLDMERNAVFTHPDITENDALLISAQQSYTFAENSSLKRSPSLQGNVFFRKNTTDSFNGDGSEFEECDFPDDGFLCEDDDDDLIEDQNGNFVDEDFNAINNRSRREQISWGATVEYTHYFSLFNKIHDTIFGVDYFRGDTDFASSVEFAELNDDRSTSVSGIFYPDGATLLDSYVDAKSFYIVDGFSLSDATRIALSLRYTRNTISTEDQSGITPELTASHTFTQFNWGIGFNHTINQTLQLYSNINQSSRTPTPIEFACSHPDAPCTLPNTFLADPPLNEVVARNIELGFRYNNGVDFLWDVNTFFTRVEDDIIFQTTGGVSSNEGFFSNASDTHRLGLSAQFEKNIREFSISGNYSWLLATYEDDFFVSSPNHPDAVNDRIAVSANDRLTGIPEHSIQLSFSWQMNERLRWSLDTAMESGVFLRGDEGNLDNKTNSTFNSDLITDLAIHYQASENFSAWLAVNNIFDVEKESFGLYGEPDEVIETLSDENTRFLSPNEPRGAWLGIKYTW